MDDLLTMLEVQGKLLDMLEQVSIAWKDYRFSIDLVTAAQKNYDFLQYLTTGREDIFKTSTLRNAIRRYELFWLPLVARSQKSSDGDGTKKKSMEPLVPPIDVYCIWYCHMLAPQQYRVDCEQIVGKFIDHQLLDFTAMKRLKAKQIWTSEYLGEPWDYVESEKTNSTVIFAYAQKSAYALLPAAQRCYEFAYQLSLPHYRSKKFLTKAENRYRKFLYIENLYPGSVFSPSYSTDFIWTTHMLHPTMYVQDMKRCIGTLLLHNDSHVDQSAFGLGKRNRSWATFYDTNVRQLWLKHFKELPSPQGSLHRGHDRPTCPPYCDKSVIEELDAIVQICGAEAVSLTPLCDNSTVKFDFLTTIGQKRHSIGNDEVKLACPSNVISTMRSMSLKFQPKIHDLSIEVDFADSDDTPHGRTVVSHKKYEATISGNKLLSHRHSSMHKPLHISVPLLRTRGAASGMRDRSNSDPQNFATLKMQAFLKVDARWALRLETFEKYLVMQCGTLMPEKSDGRSMKIPSMYDLCWTAAQNKPGFETNPTVVLACHKLLEQKTKSVYDLYVLHSAHALLTLILLMKPDNHEIVASAQIIGPHALPSPEDVEQNTTIPTLIPPQRAMIVRNAVGDFAILVGIWQSKNKMDNVGEFRLNTYFLQGMYGKQQRLESKVIKPRDKQFTLGDASLFLHTDIFNCFSDYPFEHAVCLVAAGCVFNFCNPDRIRDKKVKYKNIYPCAAWPFVVAAGYGVECPSNKYFLYCRKKMHEQAMERRNSQRGVHDGTVDTMTPFFAGLGSAIAIMKWKADIGNMYMVAENALDMSEHTGIFAELQNKVLDAWNLVVPPDQSDQSTSLFSFLENIDVKLCGRSSNSTQSFRLASMIQHL